MDTKTLKHFKIKLLREKEGQLKSLKNREKEEDETMELLDSELSSYDNHPADIGTEVYMMEQEKGYKEQIKNTIEEIDSSLEDIENNKYGICINCNKDIKRERLEIIPYSKTCLKCSDKDDMFGDDSETLDDKKIYESLNYKSFGLDPNDNKENVGYDREDTYAEIFEDNIVPKDPSFSTGDNMGIIEEGEFNESGIVEKIEDISQEYYKDTLE